MSVLEIHPSTLTGASDCELRAMVGRYPQLFRDAGFEPREQPTGAGAAVGQGVHGAAKWMANQQILGQQYTLDDGVEFGINAFREHVAAGWLTDEETPSANDAEKQIGKMTRAFWIKHGIGAEPVAVEKTFKVGLSNVVGVDGYILEGTLDRFEKVGGVARLVDLKTGKRNAMHPLQLAAYFMLAKTHGLLAQWIGHIWVPRVPLHKPQLPPVVTPYNLADAVGMLRPALRRLTRNVEAFKATGNPMEFNANASSMLCGAKYCNAYGTDICPLWRIKEAIK